GGDCGAGRRGVRLVAPTVHEHLRLLRAGAGARAAGDEQGDDRVAGEVRGVRWGSRAGAAGGGVRNDRGGGGRGTEGGAGKDGDGESDGAGCAGGDGGAGAVGADAGGEERAVGWAEDGGDHTGG